MRIHHEAVIMPNGFHRSASRKNRLTAAAITTEIMMNDRSSQNNMITVADMLIDQYRGKAARRAKILKIPRNVAVAVVHPQTAGYYLTDAFSHFFLRHQTMRSQRKDDLHIFIRNTKPVHFIDQNRHEIKTVGHTGRIIADKSNGISRLNDLVDRLLTDRMINGIQHGLLHISQRSNGRHLHLADQTRFIQRKRLGSMPIRKRISFHPDILLNNKKKMTSIVSSFSLRLSEPAHAQ